MIPGEKSLVETVRALAGELGDQVADAREIRLLCTRGHYVIDLAVMRLSDGLVLTAPLDGLNEQDFPSGFREFVAAARRRPPRGTPGLLKQSENRIGVYARGELEIVCPREKKCDPRRGRGYKGSFEYYSFSAEVGAAAAQGHAEYQLTN